MPEFKEGDTAWYIGPYVSYDCKEVRITRIQDTYQHECFIQLVALGGGNGVWTRQESLFTYEDMLRHIIKESASA